jgi:hypothetical protein
VRPSQHEHRIADTEEAVVHPAQSSERFDNPTVGKAPAVRLPRWLQVESGHTREIVVA